MKSDLTNEIEKALTYYESNANIARGRNLAFEVPVLCSSTKGGLVDAVEVTERMVDDGSKRTCCLAWMGKDIGFSRDCLLGRDSGLDGCDRVDCRANINVGLVKDIVNIYCYEIKVSKSDFMSKNGHNFVGNYNYYIMPKELYPQVKENVPDDIGVILYSPYIDKDAGTVYAAGSLRKKKHAEYIDIGDEAQKWLILSVFKRMRKVGDL